MSIKRYDPGEVRIYDAIATSDMDNRPKGEYVLFIDHEADKASQANDSHALWVKKVERVAELTDALSGLLTMYVGMVNSGDCGNWNPEEEKEVIAAREALKL